MTNVVNHGRTDQEVVRLAALGLMATGIVHDFGNLMQIVTSAIHLIERNLDQPETLDIPPSRRGPWPLLIGLPR